jgi:hypothetical protein
MKKVFLILLPFTILVGCQQRTPQTEQIVAENTVTGKNYGASFEENDVLTVTQLEQAVQQQDSIQAVVTGEIASSCQSKGCWMDVRLSDNSTMKVTFRDYGFFLPIENLEGKTVIFTGIAKRELISVDDQRHYAKDAGKSDSEINAIANPSEEIRFVADGVIIK